MPGWTKESVRRPDRCEICGEDRGDGYCQNCADDPDRISNRDKRAFRYDREVIEEAELKMERAARNVARFVNTFGQG